MGILKGVASLLLDVHAAKPFSGRVLQLGRQEILFSGADLIAMAAQRNLALPNREELSSANIKLTDAEFFRALGFSEIHILDHKDFGNPDVAYDLNRDDLPDQYRNRYDCIVDGGTMEHVFHLPNLLKNLTLLLAPGGRIVHTNPASNCVEHGFYSFSPCFYSDYYRSNGFQIDALKLLNLGTRWLPVRMTAYDFVRPLPRFAIDGYLHGTRHYVFCVVTKTPEATWDKIPQQGFYASLWESSPAAANAQPEGSGAGAQLKEFIKKRPGLDRILRRWGTPLLRWPRIRGSRKLLARMGVRV